MIRLAALLCICAAPAAAFELQTGGYVKNLQTFSRSRFTRRALESNLTRARLSLDASQALSETRDAWRPPRRALRAHVDYDHELRFGTFLRSPDFTLLRFGEPAAHYNLSQNVSSGTAAHYRHLLYRAWIQYRAGEWRLRFGRQRIAWGAGKLWNAVDFLNPYIATQVERDQRRGVDALYLRRPLGSLGQAEFVYTLAHRFSESDLLARLRGQVLGADVSLLGGKVAASSGSFAVGGDFARDAFGGSLRGEWLHVDLKVRPAAFKGLLGYEYSWAKGAGPLSDAWATVEYFHNGLGGRAPRHYDNRLLLSGREVTLARDYLGGGFTKELHPLVKFEAYLIVNLSDRSHFAAPQIIWNAWRDLHLSAGWQRFGGSAASEFGRSPNLGFLQAQYFF